MKKQYFALIFIAILAILSVSCKKGEVYKTLIITGQSEHNWKASSPALKQILEATGIFSCEIVTAPEKGSEMMSSFAPDFSKYKLVVLDYSGDPWPGKTNQSFVEYVKNGGGVVVYHGASFSFPWWKEYNEITGLGGWNNRNEDDGPYVYYSRNELVIDTSKGPAGSHGERHDFEVRTRITDHPITKGLPMRWMHGSDELYQQLRGPANNMTVLATAFADTAFDGTGRDEPMLMVINYGEGRVFHTAMGHADEGGGPAMQCTGFIVTLQRGAEWAVTGAVTQKIPFDFPTADGVVLRPGFAEITLDDAFENLKGYDIPESTRYFTYIQSQIRNAAGDEESLLKIEKRMTDFIKSGEASKEAKKLILRELSWMGTEYSVPAIKEMIADPDLKDDAEFASKRLQNTN
jgi:type 1 glutamine amidotransferase